MAERLNRAYFRTPTVTTGTGGTILPGERLLAGDEPTEDTFRKLLDSTAFIIEVEDRAKEAEQGLCKIVDGATAKAGTEPTDGFTYVAKVINLPQLVETVQTIGTLTSALISVSTDAGESNKNVYSPTLSNDFIAWLLAELSAFDVRITALEGLTAGFQADIAQINLDIAQIQSDLTALTTRVSDLETADTAQDIIITSNTSRITQNETDIADLQAAASVPADGFVLGQVVDMSFNEAPNANFVKCDGQAISRTTFVTYFGKVGTTYGAGNGSTTFNVPDLAGKGVRGHDTTNPTEFGVGVSGGSDTVALVANNIPQHDHGINFTGIDSGLDSYNTVGTDLGAVASGDNGTVKTEDVPIDVGGTTDNNITTGTSVDIQNPYLVLFPYVKII